VTIELQEERYISAGTFVPVAIDYTKWLDGADLLTGIPTVTEVGTSGLTLASKVINTAALTINDRTAAIGKAVQFTVVTPSNGAGTNYVVVVTATSVAGYYEPVNVILRCV
jgi:hypothetical protein